MVVSALFTLNLVSVLLARLRCKCKVGKDDIGLIGAPCILFSRRDCFPRSFFLNKISLLRYGLMEGFGNQDKAKVHLAAAKYQQRSTVSVHENVADYDEE